MGPFYKGVIEEVVKSLRRTLLDDGYDESVLESMKIKWTRRLAQKNVIPMPNTIESTPSSTAYAQMFHARKMREELQPTQQSAFTGLVSSEAKPVIKQDFVLRDDSQMKELQSSASKQGFCGLPMQHQQRIIAATSDRYPTYVPQQQQGRSFPVTNLNVLQQIGSGPGGDSSSGGQGSTNHMPQMDGVGDGSDSTSESDDDDDFISPSVDDRNRSSAAVSPPKLSLLSPSLADGKKRKKNGGSGEDSADKRARIEGGGSDSEVDSEDMDDLDLGEGIMEANLILSGGSDDGASGGSGFEEGKPLNSEDDITDEDAEDMFDCKNVVICQFEKVNRLRNKWRFYLKDGIMDVDGKDYIFQKATGEANW